MRYTVTLIGNLNQWVITDTNDQFVGEYGSLTLALGYLATIMVFGDSVTYIDEPVQTV